MIEPGSYDSIISALYATVTDPGTWAAALDALRRGFDCTITSLNTHSNGIERAWSTAPGVSDDWARHWVLVNPIGTRGMKAGDVALARDRVDHETLVASAYYNEFLLPADIPQVMMIRGINADRYGALINLMRGRRQAVFDEADLADARRLSSHVVNALSAAAMLGWKSWEQLIGALETSRDAMILVDARGQVLHLNRAARALTAVRDGITVSERGLDAVIGDGKRLRQAIWQAATAPAPRTGAMLTIERPAHARPLIASISPLAEQLLDIGVPRPRALIAILDPARAASSPADDLQRLFGLTRREADVAQALAEGLTIAEAAQRCGVTLTTARNYLARVLRKTQLNRQGELILYLNGIARLTEPRRLDQC